MQTDFSDCVRYRTDTLLKSLDTGFMAKQPISRTWTDEDIAKLRDLAARGATRLRAAAALGRGTASIQKKARELGLSFPGTRETKASARDLQSRT